MNPFDLTDILKQGMEAIGLLSMGYAWKSFRSGMVCSVLLNQARQAGGDGTDMFENASLEYAAHAGGWTNAM